MPGRFPHHNLAYCLQGQADCNYPSCRAFIFFFPFSWFNRLRKQERCPECGSVYKMDYIGAEASHDDHHHDDHSGRIDDGRKQTPSLICRRYWLSALLFPGGGFITQYSRGKTNIFDSMLTDVRTEPIDLPTMADFVKPRYW